MAIIPIPYFIGKGYGIPMSSYIAFWFGFYLLIGSIGLTIFIYGLLKDNYNVQNAGGIITAMITLMFVFHVSLTLMGILK